jgi:hypothetical protein
MPGQIQKKASAAKIIISTFAMIAAIAFIIAASAHLQLTLSLGIAEPKIIPAAIVEGLCALFFINSTYRIFSKKTSAWKATFFAHAFAIAGILLGQISLALGRGPRTESNDIYHSIMLALIIADAFYLMTEAGKSALKK